MALLGLAPRRPLASWRASWPASPAASRDACVHGPASPSWSSSCCWKPFLEHLDVRGSRALLALFLVVAHLRAFGQRLESLALDRTVVHEQVLPSFIGHDESEALVVAEPLHGACSHCSASRLSALRKRGGRRQAATSETRRTALVERTLDPDGQCRRRVGLSLEPETCSALANRQGRGAAGLGDLVVLAGGIALDLELDPSVRADLQSPLVRGVLIHSLEAGVAGHLAPAAQAV